MRWQDYRLEAGEHYFDRIDIPKVKHGVSPTHWPAGNEILKQDALLKAFYVKVYVDSSGHIMQFGIYRNGVLDYHYELDYYESGNIKSIIADGKGKKTEKYFTEDGKSSSTEF
jgi:hypothetical protein